jgi:hypothetical protein
MADQIRMRHSIGTRDESFKVGDVLTVGKDVTPEFAAALCAGSDPNAEPVGKTVIPAPSVAGPVTQVDTNEGAAANDTPENEAKAAEVAPETRLAPPASTEQR